MVEVIGEAKRNWVKLAKKLGFDYIVWRVNIDHLDEETKRKLMESKVLYFNCLGQTDMVEERLGMRFNLDGLAYVNVSRFMEYPVIIEGYLGNLMYDLATGSMSFAGPLRIPEELKMELAMLSGAITTLKQFDLLKVIVGNPVIRIEIPNEEELEQKIATIMRHYENRFYEALTVKVMRETASLKARIKGLEKELEKYRQTAEELEETVFEKVEFVLKMLRNGWRLTQLQGKVCLVYPKIKVKMIGYHDNQKPISEEHADKFYIKNLIVPLDKYVYEAFAVDAYHPNVDPVTETFKGKRVHKVCMGILAGKSFEDVVIGIVPMLEKINLSSAYPGNETKDAEEIAKELFSEEGENKEGLIMDWEV